MADRDRDAIDIHLRRVPAQIAIHRDCLCRERLVRLDQIQIGRALPGPGQHLARRRDRPRPHHRRINACGGKGSDTG